MGQDVPALLTPRSITVSVSDSVLGLVFNSCVKQAKFYFTNCSWQQTGLKFKCTSGRKDDACLSFWEKSNNIFSKLLLLLRAFAHISCVSVVGCVLPGRAYYYGQCYSVSKNLNYERIKKIAQHV